MNAASRAKAMTIDREKRRLETIGIRAATAIGRRARVAALRALRRGDDPGAVAVREIEGLAPVMLDAAVASHLQGRLRTATDAAPKLAGVSLARGSGYNEAMRYLSKALGLDSPDLAALNAQFNGHVGQSVRDVATLLSEKIRAATDEIRRDNLHNEAGIAVMRRAFDAAGVTPANAYTIENAFRTETAIAYEGGRWQANEVPEIQDLLWGFEYSAVGDDRTTPLCLSLDGMIRPKDDPAWDRFTPPNHYSCRSVLLNVYNDDSPVASPVPDVEPGEGFGFNPGRMFADVLV